MKKYQQSNVLKLDPKKPKLGIDSIKEARVPKAVKKRFEGKGFHLTALIGRGGMGEIYRARQSGLDRSVALKTMKEEFAGEPENRESFIREAVVTGSLSHPNIVPVHELSETDDGIPFYSMREVRGVPWVNLMFENPLHKNLEILLKVCDAVAYANHKGIIHRDLKPDNVMLGEYGEVLVMDWGIAASAGSGSDHHKADVITKESDLEGTVEYMPPEMATGDPDKIGVTTDVYLLGGILFKIITKKTPHQSGSLEERVKAAANNIIQRTGVRGELMDIAMKAMATEPVDRFPSVKVFQKAIRAYQFRAECLEILDRAKQDLTTAKSSGKYDDFSQALFGFREAFKLWPEHIPARKGLADAISAYANTAFRKGDLDLALSLLDDNIWTHKGFKEKIIRTKKARRLKRRRIRLLTSAALGLVLGIPAVLGVLAYQFHADKERAVRSGEAILAGREKLLDFSREHLEDADADTPGEAQRFAACPERNLFAVATDEGIIQIIDTRTAKEITRLKGAPTPAIAIEFSPDGQVLTATGGNNLTIGWALALSQSTSEPAK